MSIKKVMSRKSRKYVSHGESGAVTKWRKYDCVAVTNGVPTIAAYRVDRSREKVIMTVTAKGFSDAVARVKYKLANKKD